MRVYLTPPQPSRGLQRIADALTRYKPADVEVVEHIGGADVVIFYAIGRRDSLQRLTEAITKSKFQRYAIIQVCLRSTMQPSTDAWYDIWANAVVVWSYYDLQRALIEDDQHMVRVLTNFYHAPLGADAEVFYPRDTSRHFIIATSGLSRLSESVREASLAAQAVNSRVFHLGPEVLSDLEAFCRTNISDDNLAYLYSQCYFVSGLRRTEGFELPAVEGLLCGARPIVFDTPDYRWNYGDHAVYIHEGSRAEVVESLVEIFKGGACTVTAEEREQAVERFNWETIVGGFYERIS